MMDYVKTVFSKYADFTGRARRSEYWYFILFNFLLGFVLGIFDNTLGLTYGDGINQNGILASTYNMVVFIPSLAVGARRLHDTGRSGWWQLLVFTIIGIILLIVWYATEGQPHANEYGPDPKNPLDGEDDIISHLVD